MVPRKQAGHMTCTRPQAERQILLATRASSTHDPQTGPRGEASSRGSLDRCYPAFVPFPNFARHAGYLGRLTDRAESFRPLVLLSLKDGTNQPSPNEVWLPFKKEPVMDTEKTQYGNGQGYPSAKKPIIDQMTDLAAEAAGTLAATAVKAAARKARKAAAKRLPRPVKRAANTIAKAAKALASGVGAILRPFGAGIMFK